MQLDTVPNFFREMASAWSDGTQIVANQGLRTHNEGINQRNLKFWADVADKICFGRTYEFGIGI